MMSELLPAAVGAMGAVSMGPTMRVPELVNAGGKRTTLCVVEFVRPITAMRTRAEPIAAS